MALADTCRYVAHGEVRHCGAFDTHLVYVQHGGALILEARCKRHGGLQ